MLMMTTSQRDLVRDRGTVFGRFLIGLLFFGGGMSMLLVEGPANVALYFTSLGLPYASLLVWPVIALKIVAGLAIILGYRVGLASASLIGFTAAATMVAHRDFADSNLFKNLAIIGALMYLMAYGPGGALTRRFAPTMEDMDGDGIPDEQQPL